MAYTNDTVTSMSNLINKLDTWMGSNGWTAEHLDLTTTAGTGGEWAMRRTGSGYDIRFAASWDAANTPNGLALYQYADQNYVIADRPWGQDHDSGNGAASTLDASIIADRHVLIGDSPVQYWAFEDDHYTHIVVETATGIYAHFGFGQLDKLGGDWTGGEYVYGQRNSNTVGSTQAPRDDRSHLLDGLFNDTSDAGGLTNGSELYAATIHCEGMPNQAAGGYYAVCMGGKESSPQTDFGQDRQSNDGVSSDTDRELMTWGYRSGPFANGFYRMDGTDLSGHRAFWPICVTYVDTTTGDIHGTPLGQMKGVGGLSIKNYDPGEVITIGGDEWVVFPAHRKYSGSGAETGTSGYLGIAYKRVA